MGTWGPWGPCRAWGHQASPTAYPVVCGGMGRRMVPPMEGGGMVPRGPWAAQDMEQGALALTKSFPLHYH